MMTGLGQSTYKKMKNYYIWDLKSQWAEHQIKKSGLGVFDGCRRGCYLMTCHVSIGVSAMPWPL